MSQPQMKLSECNRCKSTGFSGVTIGFVQGGVNKDGKVFWNLVNKDNTAHSHLSPLNQRISTQTAQAAPTTQTAPPTATTNGTTTKDQQIQKLHDTRVETELQHIQAINNQTITINENT